MLPAMIYKPAFADTDPRRW